MESKILAGLNPAQRAAVVNYNSPSLIIAGAGSGKTRVLTSRIAYMIEQGVAPHSILALTFTNKAAAEMRERIEQMVPGGQSRYISMGTFHSVFSRILHVEAERIGFPQTFTIYEPSDCRNLVKTILKEMNLSDENYKPQQVCSRISLAKNKLITPAAYAANAAFAAEDRQRKQPQFAEIYDIYCRRCKHNGAMDFDDLLLQINILFRDCPDVLARYQERFKYILVDEYQDTNYAQYIIIRRLAQYNPNVCVVGDDAQSIYSFRGANVENILNFKRDFPMAQVFKLEQNYRSTQTIVNAANSLIERNSNRLDKECFSAGEVGEKIRVVKSYTDREEAELMADDLRQTVLEGGDEWSEAAVLYRTNAQSLVVEEAMRRRGIPYRIYKGNSFYDHKEIKDVLAYIRLVINPLDDEAFRRIVNYPARGIGEATVAKIAALAASEGRSMWEAVDKLLSQPEIDPANRLIAKKVGEFVQLIRELSLARTEKDIYELGLEIATRSGIIGVYRMSPSPESTSALDNIEELLNSMQLFKEQRDAQLRNGELAEGEGEATIDEWLQNVMLLTDMDKDDPDDRNRVTLMTVHAAKGLEFKYIYVVGMEDDLFPSKHAVESMQGLEEERRLFYVALTRAKCRAVLSFSETRFKWGNMEFCRPSRFLGEIDRRYLDVAFDLEEERQVDRSEQPSAIEQLRQRFDYRYKNGAQPSADAQHGGYERRSERGERGNRGTQGYRSDERGEQRPRPSMVVEPVRPSNLRRISSAPSGASAGAGTAGAPSASSAGNLCAGVRVEHSKFGTGVVLGVEPSSMDTKITVRFDDPQVGRKSLLAKYAKLRIIQ